METLPDLKKGDLQAYLSVLNQVKDSGLLERFDVDIIAQVQDIKERVRALAAHWYQIRLRSCNLPPA